MCEREGERGWASDTIVFTFVLRRVGDVLAQVSIISQSRSLRIQIGEKSTVFLDIQSQLPQDLLFVRRLAILGCSAFSRKPFEVFFHPLQIVKQLGHHLVEPSCYVVSVSVRESVWGGGYTCQSLRMRHRETRSPSGRGRDAQSVW